MYIDIFFNETGENNADNSVAVEMDKSEPTLESHIDQKLKSDVDQYIKTYEGVPPTRSGCITNRVQKQVIRLSDDAPLQTKAPISMLIPRAICPSRQDDFEGLDDGITSFEESEQYPQYKESFAACLRKYTISKNLNDAIVCEKANLPKQQWEEFLEGQNSAPEKSTVIAIALALKLRLDETIDLLQTAGFELTHSHVFDLIIEYSINNELYDVLEVNEILAEFSQPQLVA